MDMIVSWERLQITSQRRITTFSRVAKISFLKPRRRNSFQICSIGFISGVYGGIKNRRIFSGTQRVPDLCHAAPSQQRRMMSSGYCFAKWLRKRFMQTVLLCGRIMKRRTIVPFGFSDQLLRPRFPRKKRCEMPPQFASLFL